ncbi:peptidoglycan-binding domain-containing protein [Nocardia shimofusensis]|uniref:peptidoglycan-binding domain-containing protein n=1 Tax=Nocardia shimofusensis TaxID=228596 RepID=UPI0008339944|nr:peptidoglycan-binding domain-containing protein [Nocardia shimofusensis]
MGLNSMLFTSPARDEQLEKCLISDPAHIGEGINGTGEHVRRIQIALNELESLALGVDGIFGQATGDAVENYKNRRGILAPGQLTADRIVGKGTIKRLDDDIAAFEQSTPPVTGLVAPTDLGAAHNHLACPTPPRVSAPGPDNRAQHRGTPINPIGNAMRINIYGEGETDYLGFQDFATEPQFARGRPLTSTTLVAGSASDICARSAPLSAVTLAEIRRIAQSALVGGCRFTYASNPNVFQTPRADILSLGTVIQQHRIADPANPGNPQFDMEVWVVDMF